MDFLRALIQPYPLLLVSLAGTLAIALRRRSERTLYLKFGFALVGILWMFSMPIVSQGLLATLERSSVPLRGWPAECETIVVLGGAMNQRDDERLAARLGETSLHRCLEAARLYRLHGHPQILVSGGSLSSDPDGPAIADAMKEFLVELGVPEQDVVKETQSRTTYENSTEVARLLNEQGIKHIVLVTDAAHMPRAAECFRQRGLQVTSASCHFQASHRTNMSTCLVPSLTHLWQTQYVAHEYIGMAYYGLFSQFLQPKAQYASILSLKAL